MKAMLLAAGLGTRLRPITDSLPKPLLPFFGISIIEHNLQWLAENGVREILVNLHHHPRKIMEALQDGSRWGVRIHYSIEPEILGTAGGIKKAEAFFDDGPFLVVNSDTLREVNLRALLQYHREKKGLATLVLKANPRLFRDRALWVNRQGRIVRFLTHYTGEGGWARKADFIGIHLLEREVLSYIPRGSFYEINAQVYPKVLARGRPLYGFLHHGPWSDLGTLRNYQKTHFSVLDGQFPLRLEAREVDRGTWIGPRVRLGRGVQLRPPLFIGADSRIGEEAGIGPYAVIGRGCSIGREAQISRTILLNGVRIREGEILRGRIAAKDFSIQVPERGRVAH